MLLVPFFVWVYTLLPFSLMSGSLCCVMLILEVEGSLSLYLLVLNYPISWGFSSPNLKLLTFQFFFFFFHFNISFVYGNFLLFLNS